MSAAAYFAIREVLLYHMLAYPEGCTGCDWVGTDHPGHLSDLILTAVLPGTGTLEGLDNDALLALLPRAQATIADADSNIRWIATVLRTRRVSYAVIGRALGVSRQAAWERFSKDTAR